MNKICYRGGCRRIKLDEPLKSFGYGLIASTFDKTLRHCLGLKLVPSRVIRSSRRRGKTSLCFHVLILSGVVQVKLFRREVTNKSLCEHQLRKYRFDN